MTTAVEWKDLPNRGYNFPEYTFIENYRKFDIIKHVFAGGSTYEIFYYVSVTGGLARINTGYYGNTVPEARIAVDAAIAAGNVSDWPFSEPSAGPSITWPSIKVPSVTVNWDYLPVTVAVAGTIALGLLVYTENAKELS